MFSKLSLKEEVIGATVESAPFGELERIMTDLIVQAYKKPSLRKAELHGYKLFPTLSTKFQAVYYNGSQPIVAIRGASSKKELRKDIQLEGRRIREVEFEARRDFAPVLQRFGRKIILAGHSLGGFKAILLSKKHNLRGAVFNPFLSKLDSPKILNLIQRTPTLKKFSIDGDVLSSKVLRGTNAHKLEIKGLDGLFDRHRISAFKKVVIQE